MAGLDYHKTIPDTTDYTAGLGGSAIRNRHNDNEDILHDGIQDVENRLEDAEYETFGSGVISGMTATIGTGLSVNVAAGEALIGIVVEYAGGTVSVPANQSNGTIYFAQNGNFYTSPPSNVAYFAFCSYVSGASNVTSVGSVSRILPCILVEITDTFQDVHVGSSHTLDYEIDHSGSRTLKVPGFIESLTVSPSEAFTIEHIDPEDDTGSTFKVRITRNAGYHSYSDYYYIDGNNHGPYATCDISFTRTGLAYAT